MKTETEAVREQETEKKGRVPKLRFPEFRDAGDWEEKRLYDLLFETKHRNRELMYGPHDVLSVSGEFGCVNQIEFLGRSYAGVSVKDYHVVDTGDIVYTKSPLKKNPFGIIKENKGKPGIVSTLYAVYRVSNLCYPSYLDHYFSRDYHLNSYLQPIVKKGAKNDMKVNNFAVLGGKILVPIIPEQQKIAACLSSLDDLITAHTGKLDALKTYKKGLMQQLFPAEGETVPSLRFPEFRDAGEWQEKKLMEFSDIKTGPFGSTLHESDYKRSGTPIITVEHLGEFGITRQNLPYISDYDVKRLKAYSLKENDIVFSRVGSVDRCAIISPSETGWLFSGRLLRVRVTDQNYSPIFLNQNFKQDQVKNRIRNAAVGQTMPSLNTEILNTFSLILPSLPEQQKIASCLSSLDELIIAHTGKLGALKTYKKGLMQQLFPSGNGGDE